MILRTESSSRSISIRIWLGKDFSARSNKLTLVTWRLTNVRMHSNRNFAATQWKNKTCQTAQIDTGQHDSAIMEENSIGGKLKSTWSLFMYVDVFLWIKGNKTVRGFSFLQGFLHFYIDIKIWQLNVDLHLAQSISNSSTQPDTFPYIKNIKNFISEASYF